MKISLEKLMDLPKDFEQSGIFILFQKVELPGALFCQSSKVLHSYPHHISRHSLFVPKCVYEASLGVRRQQCITQQ